MIFCYNLVGIVYVGLSTEQIMTYPVSNFIFLVDIKYPGLVSERLLSFKNRTEIVKFNVFLKLY